VTPALPDILNGIVRTLATPSPPESSGEFMAGKIGLVSMLLMLSAQEVERGLAARVWENAALRERLGDPPIADADLSLSALDAANATLRMRLIAAHADAEARGDAAADRAFLELYEKMAEARRLEIPGG
jgi:hypothetical protein